MSFAILYYEYIVLIMFQVLSAGAMYSSKVLEGYPAGYLSNCPGINKTIPVSTEALQLLTITVQARASIFGTKATYNYFQMKELAKDSNLDWRKPSMLYVGGYMDHPKFFAGKMLGTVYKKMGFNVFLLNTNPFTFTDYVLASRNVRTIAKPAADILVYLTEHGLDPQRLTIVGLSLGAHTASFIAKQYKLMTGRSIARITGLDPSGPCFRNLGPEDRLDESDADFVDVIKTSIDGFGMAAPIGHVNFYINGGEFQPGDLIWSYCDILCSHLRSLTIWVAALNNPNSFIGMKCGSVQEARNRDCYSRTPLITNVMGLSTDRREKGIFYVATDNIYPYFLKEKGLKRKNDFYENHLRLNKGKLGVKDPGLISKIYNFIPKGILH